MASSHISDLPSVICDCSHGGWRIRTVWQTTAIDLLEPKRRRITQVVHSTRDLWYDGDAYTTTQSET
eukprot:5012475-Heterocapsa_arctica.AAC.1